MQMKLISHCAIIIVLKTQQSVPFANVHTCMYAPANTGLLCVMMSHYFTCRITMTSTMASKQAS